MLPMIAVSVRQSVCRADSLGFGVQKRLNGSRSCLRTTTPGGSRNIVLHGGPNSSTARGGEAHSMQPLPSYFGLLLVIDFYGAHV